MPGQFWTPRHLHDRTVNMSQQDEKEKKKKKKRKKTKQKPAGFSFQTSGQQKREHLEFSPSTVMNDWKQIVTLIGGQNDTEIEKQKTLETFLRNLKIKSNQESHH